MPYHKRAFRRPLTDVWPIALGDPLPTVPVPLLPGDADVHLDLQAALTNVYDLLGYRYALNYAELPPSPPFTERELAWIRSRVQSIPR